MVINGKDYKINRDTAVVGEWDKIYCQLLKDIIDENYLVKNRTGVDCYSLDSQSFKIDIGKTGFPILESKKVNIRNALSEMLWIYLAQSNEIDWLQKRGNNIWNEWEVAKDGYWYAERNIPDGKGGYNKKLVKKYIGKEYAGTIGTAYGWINHKFKRVQYVLQQLKDNPIDRRMVISLWQDEYLDTAVLPSCVWSSEWNVHNGRLNVYVHQRSCDVPLGLPFNVSQYAILQAMFAKVSNLEVGNLNWSIMDAHIYENQIDGIKLQLKRFDFMNEMESLIKNGTDEQIEKYYQSLLDYRSTLDLAIEKENKPELTEKRDVINEKIIVMELMITKDKPELYLADKDNFFDYSTDFNLDKEYLKTNMTGNEDIKIMKYKSAPFIRMPIAQ